MTMPNGPASARRSTTPGRRTGVKPVYPEFGLNEFLVSGILVAVFLYEVLFNLLPANIRIPLAGGLALTITLLSVASIMVSPKIWRVILFALLLLVAACWIIGEANGGGRLDFSESIRFLLPLFFALWIIHLRHAIHPRLILFLTTSTLIIATLSSVLRPQEIIGNLLRLPAFTGGEDGSHASAYVVALCGLLIHQIWLNGAISKRLAWSLLALAGVLLIGMRVATPIFMLLNYGLLHILLTKRLRTGSKILLWSTIFASIVAVLFWHEALQEEVRGAGAASVENLGSGRVGTWLGRIDLLSRRSVPELLFGSGIGSDLFYSEIWWWEKKDSHHDFLTIIIESGFIGLSAILLFLFLLFRRLGTDGVPLAWFLLSGSSLSNALLQRPIIATLFWLALALAAVRMEKRLKAQWRQGRLHQQSIRQRHRAPRPRNPNITPAAPSALPERR
jgi:hypothetical protein